MFRGDILSRPERHDGVLTAVAGDRLRNLPRNRSLVSCTQNRQKSPPRNSAAEPEK
jgi:hypothetical protein